VSSSTQRELKIDVARRALDFVESGMVLGLGSGSTMAYFTTMLGERLQEGILGDIRAVPTSEKTASRARELGIPLTSLTECQRVDLVVDGADEVDPELNLIKGWGRALLREKIVAVHSDRVVIVVDDSKLVPRLATTGPVPLEILTFEAAAHVRWLASIGSRAELWVEDDGRPIITDNGNYLARCWFDGGIHDLAVVARQLADRPGILEHGLFVGLTDVVVVSSREGLRLMESAR
jgi:ribose 5-phosphate isomerase A